MILDVRTLDVTNELANTPTGLPLTAVVVRFVGDNHVPKPSPGVEVHDGALWHILHDKLPKDTDELNWSQDKGGTHVSVPMYEYIITDSEPSSLARFGAQLGLLVSHLSKPKHPLERVLVLMSNVFSRPDGQKGFCIYVGVALKQEG